MADGAITLAEARDAYRELGWQPTVGEFYTYLDGDDGMDVEVECGCAATAVAARRFWAQPGDGSTTFGELLESAERPWYRWMPTLLGVAPAYLAGYVAGFDGLGLSEVNHWAMAADDGRPAAAKEADQERGWEDGYGHAAALRPVRLADPEARAAGAPAFLERGDE